MIVDIVKFVVYFIEVVGDVWEQQWLVLFEQIKKDMCEYFVGVVVDEYLGVGNIVVGGDGVFEFVGVWIWV